MLALQSVFFFIFALSDASTRTEMQTSMLTPQIAQRYCGCPGFNTYLENYLHK